LRLFPCEHPDEIRRRFFPYHPVASAPVDNPVQGS
jgi:hypothetical protein